MDEIQEILDLRRELEQANYEYYVLDNASMSDFDFDRKLRRLEELEAAHPELASPDSPTQRVGGEVADGFAEVVHRVPLESLQDVFSFTELEEFGQRVAEALPGGVEYDVEPKVDGLSVALEYENGVFVRGATRGDGQVGGGCDGEPQNRPLHPPASSGSAALPHRPGRGLYASAGL